MHAEKVGFSLDDDDLTRYIKNESCGADNIRLTPSDPNSARHVLEAASFAMLLTLKYEEKAIGLAVSAVSYRSFATPLFSWPYLGWHLCCLDRALATTASTRLFLLHWSIQ